MAFYIRTFDIIIIMKSKWYELKPAAITLRRNGKSINYIVKELGVPKSTLSGWLKDVVLTESQISKLQEYQNISLARARVNAAVRHKADKELRLEQAKSEAKNVLDRLAITNDILDLALAMLYLGEGAKSGGTSLASSDPKILLFTILALEKVYNLSRDSIRLELHLRMDQNEDVTKKYWAEMLGVSLEQFTYTSFDKRTAGRPTYESYKGVCVLQCGNIAIQRKLISLYNLFCEKVTSDSMGA